MDIEEVYKKLSTQQINNYGELVKVRTGMFTEKDLINVFNGGNELYLRIDKQGLYDIVNIISTKISELPPKDEFNHMIDIFNLLQDEINNYYGISKLEDRLSFYIKNGQKLMMRMLEYVLCLK